MRTWELLRFRKMRNRSSSAENDAENMIWIDSQDYEADEILSHQFALSPPVQRAACALPFEGSLQESTEIIQLINHSPTLFNLSHFHKGCDPNFSFPIRS